MATNDEPVTKGDVAAIRSERGAVRDELKKEIGSVRTELKGDIANLRDELKGEIAELRHDVELSKVEIKRHFDVVIEDLRHDLIGARNDEVEVLKDSRKDHERRIRHLEKNAGLIAA